jgi:hypothetical protein
MINYTLIQYFQFEIEVKNGDMIKKEALEKNLIHEIRKSWFFSIETENYYYLILFSLT